MATYKNDARGLCFIPVTDNSILYYVSLVDIPTAWGTPNFDAGVFSNGCLTYTADINFPTPADPAPAPGNDFVTCLLPVFTGQVGQITELAVKGKNPNGVKKTGTVNNSKPIIKFELSAAYEETKPLAARTFVIQSTSDQSMYFVGVFALTPAPKPDLSYSIPFKSMTPDKTDPTKLVCDLQAPSVGAANQVTAFGCIPSVLDGYKKAKVKDDKGNEGDAGDFDYTTPIQL